MRFLISSGVAVCLAVATPLAQRGVPPQELLALTNASVVNVRTGAVVRSVTVVLRGGRIESAAQQPAPAGARVIDLGGRHVVPGLIDAHVHVSSAGQLRAALDSGVTTVRSAGVSHFVDVGLRELVRKGALAGPDVVATGYHVRPGVAPELFLDFPDLADLMGGGITSGEALRRAVRANLTRGVDWIKTLATERAGTPDTDPRKQVYSQEELRILVVEAGTKNIPVMAHAHGAEGADAAVRAGVRSIEHGTYLADDTLRMMAKQGTYFDPTADIVNDLAEPGGDYDNAGLKRRGEMMQPILKAAIGRAVKLGVKIVAGSDTGYGPNSIARVSREVGVLVDAGLTPLQALQAATITNAEMLRLEKQIGVLEAGFEADILVVDGNPLENVRTLLDPLLVISNGRVALDRLTFGK
ncbi:MAG TPA: amidohydrolase family protein [Vicinamibacterales bacterium]|nr:amidohydrolase family protein [Vicinamibacterales bacterium]